jgi:hypothetical protein
MTTTNNNSMKLRLGVSIFLSDTQRQEIKEAYLRKAAELTPENETPVSQYSSVRSVNSATGERILAQELGCTRPIFFSLIASKEPQRVGFALAIQRVLGVELVTKAKLQDALADYVDHNGIS